MSYCDGFSSSLHHHLAAANNMYIDAPYIAYRHMYTQTYTCVHTDLHTDGYIHIRMLTYTHTCSVTCLNIDKHTHTHTLHNTEMSYQWDCTKKWKRLRMYVYCKDRRQWINDQRNGIKQWSTWPYIIELSLYYICMYLYVCASVSINGIYLLLLSH